MKPNPPTHIAIIMDGNRRWAKKQGLNLLKGHQKVANEVIESLADRCKERGVSHLTLWAWSTENWNRDKKEVDKVLGLFRDMLAKNIDRLHQKDIKVLTIGDISKFPPDIREDIEKGVAKTKDNKSLTVIFALNYGGRDELIRAIKSLKPEDIANLSEKSFSQNLDTKNIPDPDLIIRPGGEKRLSGLLPWQSVYSEIYFTDILMPDFGPVKLDQALEEYAIRKRRFGK